MTRILWKWSKCRRLWKSVATKNLNNQRKILLSTYVDTKEDIINDDFHYNEIKFKELKLILDNSERILITKTEQQCLIEK